MVSGAQIFGGDVRDENFRGAALMAGSMVAFTCNDTFMKLLSDDLPVWQALFLRGLAVSALLLMLSGRRGDLRHPLSRADWRLLVVRSLAEAMGAWFVITALFHLELANVSAILAALPLSVSLAAALFLGEPLGWRRLLAIAIGGLGVALIVRPGTADFTIHSLYVVAAVVSITVRDLTSRRMSPGLPTTKIAALAAVSVTVIGGIGSTTVTWQPVALREFALLGGASVFIIGGYLFSVGAMRVGEIGFVAPFRYTSLLAALVLGLVVFGDWPDGLTLLGAAIVAATGLFTLWRERKARGV